MFLSRRDRKGRTNTGSQGYEGNDKREIKKAMNVVDVKIEDLKPADYNPRVLTDKAKAQIWESILQFGMVEPIVVNDAKGRENVIIGGHQRWYICKEMGKPTIPVVYVTIENLERERELNLRLNKNVGDWNWDELANFDESLLMMVGFDESELKLGFGLSDIDNLTDAEELDLDRLDVISVDGPNAPRLKIRSSFYFEDMEDLKVIKEFFKTGKEWELDITKLMGLIKK